MKNGILLLAFVWASPAATILAQTPGAPIKDNSFLIEEAYNQEKGVFQNILLMQIDKSEVADGGSYSLKGSFTQEWPIGGNRHQLSYTLPYWINGPIQWLDNILLNYRYQLQFKNVFLAPRISFLFPTALRSGEGFKGLQLFLPASIEAGTLWTIHLNAGYSISESTATDPVDRAAYQIVTGGASLIYNLSHRFNLMFETLLICENKDPEVNSESLPDTKKLLSILNPGFRWASNFKNEAQLVLGLSTPYSITHSDLNEENQTRFSVLLYVSYEAFFKKQK